MAGALAAVGHSWQGWSFAQGAGLTARSCCRRPPKAATLMDAAGDACAPLRALAGVSEGWDSVLR
jgi:hypothetical protein